MNVECNIHSIPKRQEQAFTKPCHWRYAASTNCTNACLLAYYRWPWPWTRMCQLTVDPLVVQWFYRSVRNIFVMNSIMLSSSSQNFGESPSRIIFVRSFVQPTFNFSFLIFISFQEQYMVVYKQAVSNINFSWLESDFYCHSLSSPCLL